MSPQVRRELLAARELLEVRLLAAALDAVMTALRLEHPTLHALGEPSDADSLLAARRLAVEVRALRAALRAYRAAVRRVLAAPLDHDMPF
jgi:hypothetical protein